MRAIVSGGAGFIGSHLVDRLLKDGHDVLVIDNGISGVFPNLPTSVKIYRLGIASFEDVPFHGYDIFFHFAAVAIKHEHQYNSRIYLDETERGTLAALEICRKNDIPKFVMPASTTIYSGSKIVPTPESFIRNDISFYGTSKYNSENWSRAYAGLFGLDVTITRFARILGPRSRNGSVWDLVGKLKENPKRLEVLGDGSQRRSFLHVEDCVEGTLAAFENNADIINVGNLDTASVRDMIEIILDETGLKPEVIYGKDKVGWPGDNEIIFPDTSKLQKLGWKPKRNSKETIRDCVRWTIKERGL